MNSHAAMLSGMKIANSDISIAGGQISAIVNRFRILQTRSMGVEWRTFHVNKEIPGESL
jgi:hypothetical protein